MDGANNESSLRLGSGQSDIGSFIVAKQQYGSFAGRLEAGYNLRLPGNVEYIETEGGGSGWIDPGDEVMVNGNLIFQSFDFISVAFDTRYMYRGKSKIGPSRTQYYTSEEIIERPELSQLESALFRSDRRVFNSDGHFLSLDPQVILQFGGQMDLVARVDIPLLGANTLFWGNLEPLGNRYSLSLFYRY